MEIEWGGRAARLQGEFDAHDLAPLGLSASSRPSPTRLNASTVSNSAVPGKTMYHHAVLKIWEASEIICPQLGVGGLIPTPRNDSAASSRMLVGISRLE